MTGEADGVGAADGVRLGVAGAPELVAAVEGETIADVGFAGTWPQAATMTSAAASPRAVLTWLMTP